MHYHNRSKQFQPSLDRRARKIIQDIAHFSEDCFRAENLFTFYSFADNIKRVLNDAEDNNEFFYNYYC